MNAGRSYHAQVISRKISDNEYLIGFHYGPKVVKSNRMISASNDTFGAARNQSRISLGQLGEGGQIVTKDLFVDVIVPSDDVSPIVRIAA